MKILKIGLIGAAIGVMSFAYATKTTTYTLKVNTKADTPTIELTTNNTGQYILSTTDTGVGKQTLYPSDMSQFQYHYTIGKILEYKTSPNAPFAYAHGCRLYFGQGAMPGTVSVTVANIQHADTCQLLTSGSNNIIQMAASS